MVSGQVSTPKGPGQKHDASVASHRFKRDALDPDSLNAYTFMAIDRFLSGFVNSSNWSLIARSHAFRNSLRSAVMSSRSMGRPIHVRLRCAS